jgi:hypothetical protein
VIFRKTAFLLFLLVSGGVSAHGTSGGGVASKVAKLANRANGANSAQCRKLNRDLHCKDFFDPKSGDPNWLAVSTKRCEEGDCRGLAKGTERWAYCFTPCHVANGVDRRLACNRCREVSLEPPKKDEAKKESPEKISRGAPEPRKEVSAVGDHHGAHPEHEALTCRTNEDCFRKSAAHHRRAAFAARERRREYRKAMQEAQEGRASTITSATELLGHWKRSIDSNPSGASPAERARFANDQRLVSQAGASRGTEDFTADDALRAEDPDILRQLAMNVELRDQERSAAHEEKAAAEEEGEFQAMADEVERRAAGLESGGTAYSMAPAPSRNGLVASSAAAGARAPKDPASSLAGGAVLAALGAEAGTGPASGALRGKSLGDARAGGTLSAPAADAEGFRPSGSAGALRDILARHLASRRVGGGAAGPDVSGGAPFPGSQPAEGGSGLREGAEEGSSGASSGVASRFTLAGSENDAEVRRLAASAEDLEAAEGLLGPDTLSLFERVKRAHRSCVARSCVVSSLP